jgi:hypothetical protein
MDVRKLGDWQAEVEVMALVIYRLRKLNVELFPLQIQHNLDFAPGMHFPHVHQASLSGLNAKGDGVGKEYINFLILGCRIDRAGNCVGQWRVCLILYPVSADTETLR